MAIFKNLRHILLYGAILAMLILLLKWLQWKFLIVDNAIDIYIGLIAIFFTVLGAWVATRLVKPGRQKTGIAKGIPLSDTPFIADEEALRQLGLSSREYEVLQHIAKGYSNAEIASALFLSLSTVKTHVSNLFLKLEVRSRTQAIERARTLKIIR